MATEEIAAAFLTSTSTMAQRIVRGKAKIRDAKIPYEVPSHEHLAERLESVLQVIYLVFNEGYSASRGDNTVRTDLVVEAIRLGRLLLQMLPAPEVAGLLALMLLHDSRREARETKEGDIVLLEDQDRKRWNGDAIREGLQLVEQALASRRFGHYTIQASIAAVHANATDAQSTDWAQIVALYGVLMRLTPSPVIELNQAVAIAMRDGAAEGLTLINSILDRGALVDYPLAYAAQADLYRRLGEFEHARAAYRRALELVKQTPQQRFLQRRLDDLPTACE